MDVVSLFDRRGLSGSTRRRAGTSRPAAKPSTRARAGAPGRLPAEGALGRLGRAVSSRAWPRAEEQHYMLVPTTCFNCESACGLLAYVDRDDDAGPEVRGQPRASRLARPQLRQGAGDASTRSPTPTGSSIRCAGREARRGPVGAGQLGRGARRHRGAHPRGDHRGPPERDHVPRRPARRGRLHRAGAGQLGRGRPQLAHQHLLQSAAAPATSSGWASTGPARTTRTPR